MTFDTIIIGAGPAGLTAAIYTARREMKTLIIGKEIGGQLIWARNIENYPGFTSINNLELINRLQTHVNKLGVEIKSNNVNKINKNYNQFIIQTTTEKFITKTVILATGLKPRPLHIPGEKEFCGRGVCYCANCDGPFYKNKIVAIIGGGNNALDAAEVLSKIAKRIYLIHRYNEFQAFEVLVNQVKKIKNIDILYQHEVKEILGDNKVGRIKVQNNSDQTTREIEVDGIFIEIGWIADTDWLKDLVNLNGDGQIIIDAKMATSQPGIFAAGDVTTSPFKQITIACGQGTIAALSAYQYLQININN